MGIPQDEPRARELFENAARGEGNIHLVFVAAAHAPCSTVPPSGGIVLAVKRRVVFCVHLNVKLI